MAASSADALGLAPPHAQLSADVRDFVDEVITSSSATNEMLLPHLRKGLEQLEGFLQLTHADVNSFGALVARDSPMWSEHLQLAADDQDVRVQTRQVLPSLQLPPLTGKDIKVGRPGRPDDAVYQKSEYARQFFPRGNFIAEFNPRSSREPALHFPIVRGYRKFTGQEDDGELQGAVGDELLSKFFTKPAAQSRWVVATTKENGEAGHLAVLKRSDGNFVFALGSKNTHLLAASLEDIDATCDAAKADGNNPYQAARPMARAILKAVLSLPEFNRRVLCELLWQTRATASFEVLCPDHQHVQLLDYVDEDTPVFYGLSLPQLEPLEGTEVCVNPVLPYELMRAFGLRTVEYEVVEFRSPRFEAKLHESKTAYQHEGAVNLFVDADACVIGMEKYKTIWYVCLRAIREKAKSFCGNLFKKHKPANRRRKGKKNPSRQQEERVMEAGEVLDNSKEQIARRFKAIQSYLQITSEVTQAYESLGCHFVDFLLDVKLGGAPTPEDAKHVQREVGDLFPVVWQEFLAHSGLSDRIDDE